MTGKAYGVRERIIERHRYNPSNELKAERKRKVIGGIERTEKRRGDIVLVNDQVKPYKVQRKGWF